ncbi:hypothetical protein SLS62_010558 [Diatrype stigma]|uniref:Methyltransferase type 11 domain-containing protein n=1 Tax=Diatrype stigma TaxID=117547 RepID=A0AAN9U932_9PEZI
MTSINQKELQSLFSSASDGNDDQRLEELIADIDRIMRLPAKNMLAGIGLDDSTTAPFSLLDHACGIGPVAAELQDRVNSKVLAKSEVLCADFNANPVETFKRRIALEGWSNIKTAVLDAQDSKLPDASFSHITINFAMHLIPNPQAALRDTMRILQPGGTFGFTVWHKDNEAWAPDMRSCFDALPFDAPMPNPLPMAPHGQVQFTESEGLERELRDHGFVDIETKTVTFTHHIESAEHYLRSFDMMKQWMMNMMWSEESKERAKYVLDTHIVKHLKEKHNNQGWDLTWKCIVVACQKPTV